MKILISNDDGINATGIKCLSEALSQNNDVYIIAPDRERSAAGHSLTLHTPLRVDEIEAQYGSKRTWITTGTPGDCAWLSINCSFFVMPCLSFGTFQNNRRIYSKIFA